MEANPTDVDTSIPPETDEGSDASTVETGSGLDENVAGALAYGLGVLTGVVFYVIEQENEFVRFHAAQSIVVFSLIFVATVGLGIVGALVSALFFTGSTGGFFVGSIFSLVLTLAWFAVSVVAFGLWIYLMVRAYQGRTPRVPVAAGIADKLV